MNMSDDVCCRVDGELITIFLWHGPNMVHNIVYQKDGYLILSEFEINIISRLTVSGHIPENVAASSLY